MLAKGKAPKVLIAGKPGAGCRHFRGERDRKIPVTRAVRPNFKKEEIWQFLYWTKEKTPDALLRKTGKAAS
jgi:hypothetical protein